MARVGVIKLPAPLRHRLDGQTLVLAESDVLTGWRYFN